MSWRGARRSRSRSPWTRCLWWRLFARATRTRTSSRWCIPQARRSSGPPPSVCFPLATGTRRPKLSRGLAPRRRRGRGRGSGVRDVTLGERTRGVCHRSRGGAPRVGGRRRGWFPRRSRRAREGRASARLRAASLRAIGRALAPGRSEADVLAALHPTPAVCGYPRAAALDAVRRAETFDRGLYAGPTGWVAADSAEFAVAIRSTLVKPGGDELHLYAGVGVVAAADSAAEWHELNLKTRPLEALLARRPSLAEAPNANRAWAEILVGELVRGGVRVFCVAPGSRSTPLALAAEQHPTARVVVCVDERSLAFYALGVGKGSGRASAVITSSGTAVANLLPAAVEAHESCAPLLLLTADRPPELRDTGANQTIDQTKIFGAFARYAVDLPPPGDGAPARVYATAAAAAVAPPPRRPRPGPVHVNCQFRDPLGPVAAVGPSRGICAGSRVGARHRAARVRRERRTRRREIRPRRREARSSTATDRPRATASSANSPRWFDPRGVGFSSSRAGATRRTRSPPRISPRRSGGPSWRTRRRASASEDERRREPRRLRPRRLRPDRRVFVHGVFVHGVFVHGVFVLVARVRRVPARGGLRGPDARVARDARILRRPDVIVQINPRVTSNACRRCSRRRHWTTAPRGRASRAARSPRGSGTLRVAPRGGGRVLRRVGARRVAPEPSILIPRIDAPKGTRRAWRSARRRCCACDAAAAREAAAALADVEADEGITEMGVALAVTERLPPRTGYSSATRCPFATWTPWRDSPGGRTARSWWRDRPRSFTPRRRGDARGGESRRERHRRRGERGGGVRRRAGSTRDAPHRRREFSNTTPTGCSFSASVRANHR